MNTTCRRAGLRAAVIALGLLAGGASGVHANPIVEYSTSGQIDPKTGVTGTPVISYNSIANNTFNSPSSFSLGAFQVAAPTVGQETTYTNTPFNISYLVKTVDGSAPVPNETPIKLTGVLNGTISGANESSVVAKFDPVSNPNFLTGNYKNTLSIFDSPLSLVPSTTNSGQTTAQAFLTTAAANPPPGGGNGGGNNNVPEPTSVALFLTTLGGLGLRQRLRGSKKPV
jgi:hypothetical protein